MTQRKHRLIRISTLALLATMIAPAASRGQNGAFDGYTLFNPTNSRTTYLLDMSKRTVHTWQHSQSGGYSVYLLPDGCLIRPASAPNAVIRGAAYSGLIQKTDWDVNLVWEYLYSNSSHIAHHDVEPMPNGNVMLIAWEVKSAAEAAAAGRSNATVMWPDHLVEVKPTGRNTGDVVWEWHAWDHLVQEKDQSKINYGVVKDHPELININLGQGGIGPGGGDWLHINGVSYDPVRDLVVISSHFMNEFYVIDHSTTTAEAAGHTGGRHGRGGDILSRWGSPKNSGAAGSTYFDVVHCSWWIPQGLPGAGNVLVFNNNARARASVIAEIVLPLDGDGRFVKTEGAAWGPASPVWTYSNGTSFFSNHLGGNQRLPNGNTFITEATRGRLLEVTPSGQIVWEYPHTREIARALRYAPDYPGLARLFTSRTDDLFPSEGAPSLSNTPNPFSAETVISFSAPGAGPLRITVHDALGRQVAVLHTAGAGPRYGSRVWNGSDAAGRRLPPGVYYCRLQSSKAALTVPMILL